MYFLLIPSTIKYEEYLVGLRPSKYILEHIHWYLLADTISLLQGHDDAVAILLAAQLSEINLLGVSTVHGNADAECTKNNAARSLYAFAAKENVKVLQ